MAVFLLIPLFVAPTTQACGKERWAIKTGTDRMARQIDVAHIVPTTIAALDALPAHHHLPGHRRLQPTETTVFRLDATLIDYKQEGDDDYHLVLRDPAGRTMIAEIPSPTCVGRGSPFAQGIRHARKEFDAHLQASDDRFKHTHERVRVTGVGFFDYRHGQTGVAPNAIELHPVLDIQFNSR